MYSDLIITVASSLYASRNPRVLLTSSPNTMGEASWQNCLAHAEQLVSLAKWNTQAIWSNPSKPRRVDP